MQTRLQLGLFRNFCAQLVLELYMQYELWKRMVLLDMLFIPCSRLQSNPDYSTVPQLCQATVLLRPSGVDSAALQATGLLWRWHPVSSGTFQLAMSLSERVLNDERHVLHLLLPSRTEYSYNLRRRRHDYELIAKTRTLNINNFIMRMLYKNSYWHFHTLSSNAYLSFILLNEYCIVLWNDTFIHQISPNFRSFQNAPKAVVLLMSICTVLCHLAIGRALDSRSVLDCYIRRHLSLLFIIIIVKTKTDFSFSSL